MSKTKQQLEQEQLETIDLIYSVIQPTRALCYDHIDEVQELKDYTCEECGKSIIYKKGICQGCHYAMML